MDCKMPSHGSPASDRVNISLCQWYKPYVAARAVWVWGVAPEPPGHFWRWHISGVLPGRIQLCAALSVSFYKASATATTCFAPLVRGVWRS